jgi:hypothetical protein
MPTVYPIGTKIAIQDPGEKPANWNRKMMELVGCVSYIRENGHGHPYRYRLQGWTWTWRHCDLILLHLPKLDPNKVFRDKKHAF